jgi:hypothetical protein
MSKLKPQVIIVQGQEIRLNHKYEDPFFSLTDIAKKFGEPRIMIQNWLRSRNTIEFLGVWESLNNPEFKSIEFDALKNEAGSNAFTLSPKKWIETVNAKGMVSKMGRYGSGTEAHFDVAAEFLSWLNPAFKLLVIQEFKRLFSEEAKRKNLEWDIRRIMSKANFQIHTEAVKKHLIPPRIKNTRAEGMVYANEADILNVALFGMTAKQWKIQNPEMTGNMRDNSTTEQLLVLSNLQSLNSKLMEWGSDAEQRLDILNKTAIDQMGVLTMSATLKQLPKEKKQLKDGK